MKKILPLFAFLFFIASAQAQLSILFVDDSADDFMNSANITNALDELSIAYTVYDAQTEGTSPDLAIMSNYDLLIWHTSSWSENLYIWTGNQTVNTDLAAYLSNGGNIWLIGNDFLYDRIGSAPVAFSTGDFEYDYLGIETFDVETYNDDGETGVSLVVPSTGQPITGLNELDWIFATLWYADGVTPRINTVPIYSMGGDGYPLEGKTCGTWYDGGPYLALTYFFDLALASSDTKIQNNLEAVLGYFDSAVMADVRESNLPLTDLSLAPMPASEFTNIQFELTEATELTIQVVDLTGRPVAVLADNQRFFAGSHQLEWSIPAGLAGGMYLVQLKGASGQYTTALQVIR